MNVAVNIPLPQVFNADMEPLGRLHPIKAGYASKLAPLSTATLELEGETISVGQFVQLFDTFGKVGKYRVSQTDTTYAMRKKQMVKLEHAFVTLGDTVMPGYTEFGGIGTTTRSVLTNLLDRQKVPYWALGVCDFAYAYQYSVENEYLANAVLSVATPIPQTYQWELNTDAWPFVVSLKAAPTVVSMELRENRNRSGVKHRIDRTELRTRLYPRGYGEGVNQLTIKSVNGGVDYLQKNTEVYGIVEDIYPDTKITDPATLKAAAQAVLDCVSVPKVTTEVDGEDVFALTGEALDRFELGVLCRVPLPEEGITLTERVVAVKKDDLYGPNQRAKLTLSNQQGDMVSDMASLMRKSRNAELYSQGSTCLYAISFSGNCDPSNPLEVQLPIDKNAAGINVLLIKYKVSAFCAYSKSAVSGGGQTRTSDGGTTATAMIPQKIFASTVNMGGPIDNNGDDASSSGGNLFDIATITDSASGTTAASGDIQSEYSGALEANSGGGGSTMGAGGGDTGESDNTSHSHSSDYHNHGSAGTTNVRVTVNSNTCSHKHNITPHSHGLNGHTHTINGHRHLIPSHVHSLNSHRHTISVHQHSIYHKHGLSIGFTFPAMTIEVTRHTHSVTIDAHSHAIEYGIYKGSTANQVTVKIDNAPVPAAISDTKDFDAVLYLQKDSDGRIVRGWHELSFAPDQMTFISGTAYIKTFVTAFSGGNY